MRRLILAALALGSFVFVAGDTGAKEITVSLSQSQVSTVCDGRNYCEKTCGSSGQYTCTFGCGTKGCSGACTNCPTGISHSALSGVIKNIGEALKSVAAKARTAPANQTTVKSNNLTSTSRDVSTGQATGKRTYGPVR